MSKTRREKDGRFKPGSSGNLKGRPKNKTFTEVVRNKLDVMDTDGKTAREIIVNVLVELAQEKMSPMIAIKAASLLMDRSDGKPLTTTEIELHTDTVNTEDVIAAIAGIIEKS